MCIFATLHCEHCFWRVTVKVLRTSVFLLVPVFWIYPCLLQCSQGVKQGHVEAFGCVCSSTCLCGEAMSHCGPPTKPCDSWGPLRQMRPTARSDSVIIGGLLLWFTLTHARTHTRTQTTPTLVSCGPFLRCCPTRPQQGSSALHRRGKQQYLISQLSCLAKEFWWSWCFSGYRSKATSLCFMFLFLSSVSVFVLALFVISIAVTVKQELRFRWLPLHTWTKKPEWRIQKNALSW